MLKASMKYMEVIELHLDFFLARPGKTFCLCCCRGIFFSSFPVKRSPEDYCCVILSKTVFTYRLHNSTVADGVSDSARNQLDMTQGA